MRTLFLLIALAAQLSVAQAQTVVDLWQGPIPGSKVSDTYVEGTFLNKNNEPRTRQVTNPTLTVYRPANANGQNAAIVICPGGGYRHLCMDKEGTVIAARLAEQGVVALVLKYRLPSDSSMVDRSCGPLADAQEAIRYVRRNAAALGVDAGKVGIMGFSAGGHLAASASVHYGIDTSADTASARPDFSVLIYPVVSMDTTITHMGSRNALVGGLSNESALADLFSCENYVDANTPPAFIVHAADDGAVDCRNSLRYAEAMARYGQPVELHLVPSGGHGFGIATGTHQGQWMEWLGAWLRTNSFISK